MRIVHCFRAPVGGVFRHVRDLADAQTAMGHSVGMVCDASTGGSYGDTLFAEINDRLELGIHRVAMQRTVGIGDLASAWKTFNVVKSLRPDVVHGHGAKGGVYSRLFGTFMKPRARRFYSPHGGSLHFDPASTKGRVIFGIERNMERISDGLFFVCNFERDTYARKVGSIRAPSHVVYNGLCAAEFEPTPLIEDPFDILFIGEIRDLKGPDVLINAIPNVEAQLGRQIRTVMVGNGGELENCQSLVASLGLTGRIEFRPAMPARQAFALARLVVVPSRAEAFPYIVLEALGAGKPVIASRVGGIPEVFGDASPALVQPGDVDALSQKLVAALADGSAYAASMPTRAELQSRFSVETMAAEITDAYGRLPAS